MNLNRRPPAARAGLPGIDPELFASLLRQGAEFFGFGEGLLVHDYHAHRGLYALAQRYPPGAVISGTRDNEPIEIGHWAFAGGTSLASAHGLVSRYSEDIDIALIAPNTIGRSPLDRARRDLARLVADAITGDDRSRQDLPTSGTITTVHADPGDSSGPVRIDVSPQQPIPEIVETHAAMSLLGRVADADIVRAHPELGGFMVPTLCVPMTAANKLAALHRLAMQNRLDMLRGRGRDLYDLACIANSPSHAQEARARIPEFAAVDPSVRQGQPVPRPAGGYASSVVFADGTEANIALSLGFDDMNDMIWDETRLSFEDAVEAARSLD